MATFTKYTSGSEALVEGINAGADVWKVALALTINVADVTFTPGTTDLATGGGYTAGGNTCTTTSSTNVAGVYKLVLASPTLWTASAGGFTFRYAVLWDSTTSNPVGYWDYGTNVVMSGTNGDTFTITLDATNGVFSVT
jgi:hypothetical protein